MQSPEAEDRWYVEIAGSVQMMTLDELVEAYEAGRISAKTLVTEVGASEWHTLAEVADLPDEDEAPAQAAAPAAPLTPALPAVMATPSYPPQASSRESAWPPAAAWGPTPGASRAPAAHAKMGSVAPASAASWPPASAAPSSMAPLSTVPVVQDLDLGQLDAPFKRSKAKTFGVVLAAAVVLGAAGFGVVKASSVPPVAAVPVPTTTPLTGPSPASLGDWKTPLHPAASPPPAAAAPSEPTAADKNADSRLSDDVRAKLAEQDKDRAAKKKAPRSGRGVRSSNRSSSSSSVFRSGGNANDPLNSKL